MNNKELCFNCGEYVDYKIEEIKDTTEFKGAEFEYVRKVAKCKSCGEEIYVSEINEENLDAMRFAYCKAVGIANEKDIDEVLNKYNIGLETLAQLLNCSVPTIKRYHQGAIIKRIYSERLLKILHDVQYCKQLLTTSKAVKIRAKKKALKAIEGLEQLNLCKGNYIIEENSITSIYDNSFYTSLKVKTGNMCCIAA